MLTEHTDHYNEGVKPIIEKLYRLRSIEASKNKMSNKYKQAKPLLNSISNTLIERNDFLLFRPMWEELHDRMVYYYDYLNNSNLSKKIPLFCTTLHNEAVKWWLEAKKRNKFSGTLIHFDTHDDMGLPDTSKYLLKKGKTLNENGIIKGACGQIYWPVTCILLSKQVDHVIWALPKWVYDDDKGFNQALVCNENNIEYIRSKKEKKDKFRLEGDVFLVNEDDLNPKLYTFYHPHRLNRMKLATNSSWNKLEQIMTTNDFVLDIDLDFFVTNGGKASLATYKKDFTDLESTGRVHGLPGKITPRTLYDDEKSRKFNKQLKDEVKLIKKRVEIFLNGLKKLKENGIKPRCINLSDSTASLFSGNYKRAVFTNEYTPKYYVPLLHHLLLDGFNELGYYN
jgi:hypothetical protein